MKRLKPLRKQIDQVDHEFFRLLKKRMQISKKILVVKVEHSLPIYQKARLAELLEERAKKGGKFGVSGTFTRKLFKLIHDESLTMQKRLAPKLKSSLRKKGK